MPGSAVYFIADVHLVPHPDDQQRMREDALIAFLRHIREDAEALYIVGDLFDFWFEYRTVVPLTGGRVLFEIYRLIQDGIHVVCLPGNHDIWLGDYLREQVGMDVPEGPMEVTHQGRRLFLAHGDEFRSDWKFRLSRGILKSRFCIACFGLLHPDLGARLASWTSSLSEHRARGTAGRDLRFLRELAGPRLDNGCDAFICGHYHLAVHEHLEGGSLVVLGDWIARTSYARLKDGNLELLEWQPAPAGS